MKQKLLTLVALIAMAGLGFIYHTSRSQPQVAQGGGYEGDAAC